MRYAEALLKANQAKTAHAVLLDLFNNVAPTPEQIRFTALAASSAGDTADAAYYMSEYHISTGNLPLSVAQLEMALAEPNITSVQRSRFQARLDEVREAMFSDRKRRKMAEQEEKRKKQQPPAPTSHDPTAPSPVRGVDSPNRPRGAAVAGTNE
jgi:predicted Zn-dependent protease